MRKKKWAEPYLLEHADYALSEPEQLAGGWKRLLECETLHVEIGTGKGDYLNRMAELYPEEGWVGIEKERNVAAVACRKAIEEYDGKFPNKRLIVGDAEQIAEWFAEGEVDVIHLNFSDPWPKKYTHKRRLSSSKFLSAYRRILSETGEIRMKTDNKDLFEDSVVYFQENGFVITSLSVDYRRHEHPEDAVTEYEQRFMDLGQPIYRIVVHPVSAL